MRYIQKEVVRTAVEVGYYEEPRGATLDDIADELGVSVGTVGQHLRKAGSRIITEVVS